MLDIKLIESEPELCQKRLRSKEANADLSPCLELHKKARTIRIELEELQAESNQAAKEIGILKREKKDASEAMGRVAGLKEKIQTLKQSLSQSTTQLEDALAMLPNLPAEDIPVSLDPADNEVIKTWGEKPKFDFEIKNHMELATNLGIIDFEKGAKIGGSGFILYTGMGARLEWALLQWMINYHLENEYEMILPPLLAKSEALYHAAQFPKFRDQVFKITDDHFDLCLLPTAEVALNAMHADEILKSETLPLKYVSMTPCFRRESGGYGKNERGMIRMHQFNKVEMFSFSRPEESDQIHNELRGHAEKLLELLEIPYQTTNLVTGDISFAAQKTYDIEAWLPAQDKHMEVSSVSNCGDFQSRRSKARFKNEEGQMTLCHTLNGSGLATSRVMVALLENFQQSDGSVLIPKVLHPYLGVDRLTPLK